MSKKRVAILFGGQSSEHEISCISAGGILGAIDHERF
ncbi:MAG: D-alanine--D-alanine ligase A, partial [Actinomycetes bacterium]